MSSPKTSSWKSFPFWVRFSLAFSNDCWYNGNALLIIRFLSLVQALMVVFGNTVIKTYHNYVSFQYWFNKLQKVTDLNHYANTKDLVYSILMILGVILFYFFMVIFVMTKSAFSTRKQPEESRFVQLCSLITSLHAEIIFYPIALALVGINNEVVNNQSLTFSFRKEVIFAIVVVLMCLNSLIVFFKFAFCYCRIKSKNLITRKSSIHLIGIAVLKLILVFLQFPSITGTRTSEVTANTIISIIFSFIVALGVLAYGHIFLPEYDFRLIKMHIIFGSAIFAVSFGQLGDLITGNENIVVGCAIMIIPLWIKMNFNYFNTRMNKLKYHSENVTNVNYCVQLETLYRYLEPEWEIRLHENKFPASSFDANWLLENKFIDPESKSKIDDSYEDRSKLHLKMYLENILKRNPSNSLAMLTYAQLVLESFEMYAKAYDLCQKVSMKKFSIPDQISLYSLICVMQSSLLKGTDITNKNNLSLQAIESSLIAEDRLEHFRAQLNIFSEKAVSFWKILKSEKPDIFSLYSKAEAIEKDRLQIEANWKTLEAKFCAHTPLALLLYGLFKTEFLNLPYEGSHLIDRYNWFARNKGVLSGTLKVNIEEYGSVTVSGERKTMGNILGCSDRISKLFGFDKEALLNRNVNVLMPRYFKERHDQFLLNYYETGQSSRMRKETTLYGKDQNDYVFPISVALTIQPNLDGGVVYTALVKKIKDQSEYILFRKDGVVEEISTGIGKLLCIKSYEGVNIAEICLHYSKRGYHSEHSDYIESQTNTEGVTRENLEMLKILTFQRINDKSRTFSYKAELSTFTYNNVVLNIMVLRPLGPLLRKRGRSKLVVSLRANVERSFDKSLTRGISETSPEYDSPALKHDTSTVFRQLNSFRNFDTGNNTERKLLGEEDTPRVIETFAVADDDDSDSFIDNIDDEQERQEALRSIGRRASSVTSTTKNNRFDNFQRLYDKQHPDKFRNIVVAAFVFLFIAGVVVAGIQYLVFQESLDDINFAISSIRQSYDRLTALVWVWRYAIIWSTRAKGFVPTNVAELTRFKLIIKTNTGLMKDSNDDLANNIADQEGVHRDLFLRKDIRLIYRITVNNLELDRSNTFETVNLFVAKLIRSDLAPLPTPLASPNSDYEFIKINTGDDMLQRCEQLIQSVETSFRDELHRKDFLFSFIFYFNMVIPLFLMMVISLNFQVRKQRMRRLINALLAIHFKDIENIMQNFNDFQATLAKKGQDLAQELQNCYLQRSKTQSVKPTNFKTTAREYSMKGISILKVKQGCFLFVLLVGFTLAYSIGYLSSHAKLQDLVDTNDRIILASKARHNLNMALAAFLYLIDVGGNSTIRNQPIKSQILESVYKIVSNEQLFDTFTDKTGQFIDSRIENMFIGHPCAFVVNFPGSLVDQHCPKVTQNNSIGMFAVNSDYQQDILIRAQQQIENTTLANRKLTLPLIINILNPKSNTLIAGYMYIAQLMNEKFNEQNADLKNNARKNLAIEILLMCSFAILSTWFLIRKVMDDRIVRLLLKVIPHQEIFNNKFLQTFLKDLYNGKPEMLRFLK